jgi:hypothetical protein
MFNKKFIVYFCIFLTLFSPKTLPSSMQQEEIIKMIRKSHYQNQPEILLRFLQINPNINPDTTPLIQDLPLISYLATIDALQTLWYLAQNIPTITGSYQRPKNSMLPGSTPVLNLCFNAYNNNNNDLLCNIMRVLLTRKPTTALTQRYDGMGPAHALVCKIPQINMNVLKIILNAHPDAAKITTANEYLTPYDITNTRPNGPAKRVAQSLLIQHAQSIPYPPTYQQAGNFNQDNVCQCCTESCLCCVSVNAGPHTPLWLKWYSQNPTHPNSRPWLEQFHQKVGW